MKKGAAVISAVMAVILSGCSINTDNRIEETDILETEITDLTLLPETVTSIQTQLITDKPENILDTITFFDGSLLNLCFSGETDGYNFKGTLTLRLYSENSTEPVSSYTVYDNCEFILSSPDSSSYGLSSLTSDLVLLKTELEDGIHTRAFELEKSGEIKPYKVISDDEHSEIIAGEYEFVTENLDYTSSLFDNFYNFFDYGNNRYAEYCVNTETNEILLSGVLSYETNAEIADVVKSADERLMLANGFADYLDYSGYLTMTGSDDEREETYYSLDTGIASTRQELTDYISEHLSAEYIEKNMPALEEDMFGGNYPHFYETEHGITYASHYLGVPISCDYDTIRVLSVNDNTAEAIVSGYSLDGGSYMKCSLVKENGKWKADSFVHGVLGTYFTSSGRKTGFDSCWNYLICDFSPFSHTAGEEITVTFKASTSGEKGTLCTDENGNPFIIHAVRAEEYTEYDMSALSAVSTVIFSGDDDYSSQMTFTVPEAGKYVFTAGCRYIDSSGEYHDIILGPQIFHVE